MSSSPRRAPIGSSQGECVPFRGDFRSWAPLAGSLLNLLTPSLPASLPVTADWTWWRPDTWPLPLMVPGTWTPLAGAPYLLVGLNLVIALVLLFLWGKLAWKILPLWWHGLRRLEARLRGRIFPRGPVSDGSWPIWIVVTGALVLHGVALLATSTSWMVPGGRQLPRHASDWILALCIPAAAAIWLGVSRDQRPGQYGAAMPVPPLAPMDGWISPPMRRRRIREWLVTQGRHLGLILTLLVWLALGSRTGSVIRPDPRVYAEPGWVLIVGVTLVVIVCGLRIMWAERVGAPSWGWIRWAFGGALPPEAVGDIASGAVDILLAEADGAMPMSAPNWRSWHGVFLEQVGLSRSSIAWMWLQLIVVTPEALPVTVVRPLLLHRDPDIRLRAIQLLGQRVRSTSQGESTGSSTQEPERAPGLGSSA